MLRLPRQSGLDSLFREVRVFNVPRGTRLSSLVLPPVVETCPKIGLYIHIMASKWPTKRCNSWMGGRRVKTPFRSRLRTFLHMPVMSLIWSVSEIRNPRPHIQGTNMNKNLDKTWPQMLQNKANSAVWGPNVCSYFCPVCGGWGFQTIPPCLCFQARNGFKAWPLCKILHSKVRPNCWRGWDLRLRWNSARLSLDSAWTARSLAWSESQWMPSRHLAAIALSIQLPNC